MIRVLLAEDSMTTLELLVAMLSGEPDMEVVGKASNGLEAVRLTRELRPHVVAMDVHMPEMDGFEATKRIMMETPTPIVIVSSSLNTQEVRIALQALKAGALTVLKKPSGSLTAESEGERQKFVATLKAMAQVKVIRHWPDKPDHSLQGGPPPGAAQKIVVIAASTGGPAALNRLLSDLPANFPAPILVVQHISLGFVDGFVSWLNGNCPFKVKVGLDGEALAAGTVYLAGDGTHLGVSSARNLMCSASEPIQGYRPSGTYLFESAARAFGPRVIAVMLTGMGRDGVAGLKAVKDAGGTVLVQDKASSVIFGMPEAAIQAGFADLVLPLGEMAAALLERTT